MKKLSLLSFALLIFSIFTGTCNAELMNIYKFSYKDYEYSRRKIAQEKFESLCKKALAFDSIGDSEYREVAYSALFSVTEDRKDFPALYKITDEMIAEGLVEGYRLRSLAFEYDGKTDEAKKAWAVYEEKKASTPRRQADPMQTVKELIANKKPVNPFLLLAIFTENEVAADAALSGKKFSTGGTIASIRKNESGGYQLALPMDEQGVNNIILEFAAKEFPSIAKLKKGQDIFASGTFQGVKDQTLVFIDCTIEE